MLDSNVFALPLKDKWLLYAPLHGISALVNNAAVNALQEPARNTHSAELDQLRKDLSRAPVALPDSKKGDFIPAFLGFLPTRDCNLSCKYCGFRAGSSPQKSMSIDLAVRCIDWYAKLLKADGEETLEIHFFGGEPFIKPELVMMVVHAARIRGEEYGLRTRFEASTNGVMNEEMARFAANFIHNIVLSIDGPLDIQNSHRPRPGGEGSFEDAYRSARVFDDGPGHLHLRSCITSDTVSRMEEIAIWFSREFRPSTVCFETLQPSPESEEAGLNIPDPWEFASNYSRAARTLWKSGIKPIYASAELSENRVSFCPVGKDVVIVSPEGEIAGCYLLERDWKARGMDMSIGCFSENGEPEFYEGAVERLRNMNVLNYSRCNNCFCRWHCAGGCHVNHSFPGCPETFVDLCIQTRIITLFNILSGMDRLDIFNELDADKTNLRRVILQPSDRLGA